MTSSVLTTFCRDSFCERDLEVVRDFALEAPWEWRIALEELCDIAEANDKVERERDEALDKVDKAETESKELRENVKSTTKKMLRYVEKLEAGRRNGNLTKGDIDNIAEGVRQAFEELVDNAE